MLSSVRVCFPCVCVWKYRVGASLWTERCSLRDLSANQRRLRTVWPWNLLQTGSYRRSENFCFSVQLSLAIPAWVGAMSTSESWGIEEHTTRYVSAISVVSQCNLVSGWGLRKRRSASPYGPYGLGQTLRYVLMILCCIWAEISPCIYDIFVVLWL